MCGGAIIANFIPPRQRGGRNIASDFWPNVKLNTFESNLSRLVHDDSALLKRRQLPSGTYPFFTEGDLFLVKKMKEEENGRF